MSREGNSKVKKIKSRGCYIATSLMLATVIFAGCGKVSPEEQAKKANELFLEEMESYTSSILDELGLEELRSYIQENTFHSYLDLSATTPGNGDVDSVNISVKLDTINDIPNKAFDTNVELGAYGVGLSLGNIIYSDSKVYLESDKFLGEDVYSFACDNFIDNYNNSAWSSLTGVKIDDEYDFTNASTTQVDGLKELSTELIENLKASTSYTALKEKKTIELDEKETKCSGIEATIDKDDASKALKTYINGLSELVNSYGSDELEQYFDGLKDIELYDNMVFDIYIDSKGRMVNVSTPNDIELTGGIISFDISLTGNDRRADDIDGEIYVKQNDSIRRITIQRRADIGNVEYNDELKIVMENNTDEDILNLTCTNDWNKEDLAFEISASLLEDGDEVAGVYADGSFSNVVKGEACTLNISNVKFVDDGTNSLIASVELKIEPTDDTVEIPETSIDLLGMSQSDITGLLYGIIVKFSQIGIY